MQIRGLTLCLLHSLIFNVLLPPQVNNDQLDSNLEAAPFTVYQMTDGKLKVCIQQENS
jgi:hypothetical protein